MHTQNRPGAKVPILSFRPGPISGFDGMHRVCYKEQRKPHLYQLLQSSYKQ
jgi:hypothetical protein